MLHEAIKIQDRSVAAEKTTTLDYIIRRHVFFVFCFLFCFCFCFCFVRSSKDQSRIVSFSKVLLGTKSPFAQIASHIVQVERRGDQVDWRRLPSIDAFSDET